MTAEMLQLRSKISPVHSFSASSALPPSISPSTAVVRLRTLGPLGLANSPTTCLHFVLRSRNRRKGRNLYGPRHRRLSARAFSVKAWLTALARLLRHGQKEPDCFFNKWRAAPQTHPRACCRHRFTRRSWPPSSRFPCKYEQITQLRRFHRFRLLRPHRRIRFFVFRRRMSASPDHRTPGLSIHYNLLCRRLVGWWFSPLTTTSPKTASSA